MPRIAKVVVEISLGREFDYLIPDRLAGTVRLGSRVLVPFRHAITRGYVVGLAARSDHPKLKEIQELIGARPILTPIILQLARWMSDYYCCTIEQAIRTVLPCAIRKAGARHRELLYIEPLTPDERAAATAAPGEISPRRARLLEQVNAGGAQPLTEFVRRTRASAEVLRKMADDGLLRIRRRKVERSPVEQLTNLNILPTQPLKLFPEQEQALAMACRAIDATAPPVILLHGVTGSGKTEVYLQAISHALEKKRGAIMLVPEISLTPQTVERFHSRFGDAIAVLHSHLSDGERHDEWHRIHDGRARIVVGARSALFAPVADLGLIVVDEEHEPSYKQAEAPRYNARDMAVMRGHMEKCAVLLGSATPALESFNNVRRGKYILCAMPHRVDHRAMPTVRVVDMRMESEREGRLNVFSRDLIEAIRQRLERGEQVILFLNRRGYATTVMCPQCGHTMACDQCSVSLTYHRVTAEILCHICGHSARAPEKCPACGLPTLKFTGIGTQRIEASIRAIFPHARVQRMDADTTTAKEAYAEILGDFKAGKTDILIGTQMIAKGLHFPGVTLVGVICADSSLHLPDFRAAERTFQLLMQVSGRAGRGEVAGEVIVQTFSPVHPAIQSARRHDYTGFCDQELEARRELMYPPFTHLIGVTFEGAAEDAVTACADRLAARLKQLLHPDIIMAGPMPAPLSKIMGRFRHQILLRSVSVKAMTAPLKTALAELPAKSKVHIAVDVDALSLM